MSLRLSQRATQLLGLTVILAGASSFVGCMESRPAINRVQPDFLDKSQLIPVQYGLLTAGQTPTQLTREALRREPQWALQITIIDKPATTGNTGISWYTGVEKVNWEVTENFLIARMSYDHLNHADGAAASDPAYANDNTRNISSNPRQGEILAVYGIQSHFDVRRSYNAQTGEELNVIEENGSDRPWYQRRYVRIDWSRNLVGGYSAMSYAEWTGKVRAEPVPMYVNDPSDPNFPVFNYVNPQNNTRSANAAENTRLNYFDITNRVILHPEEVNLAQYGYPNIPQCVLNDHSLESCQPADVTMRISFMRLDPNRDYEPQTLDGHRQDRFGFFEAGRIGYNRDRGDILNTERRHFSHRHNIWQDHHIPRLSVGSPLQQGVIAGSTCREDGDCLGLSRSASCVGATAGAMGTPGTAGTCQDRFALCAEDADCGAEAVGHGARCDLSSGYFRDHRVADPVNAGRQRAVGLCLLPYRMRQVREIPYHLSQNYPERMMPVTNTIVSDWNSAFSDAVREARKRECILDDTVADKSVCERYLTVAQGEDLPAGPTIAGMPATFRPATKQDGHQVYIGCHNPVWGSDPTLPGAHTAAEVTAARAAGWDHDSCGGQGTVARLGDIRYSMIASINEYDRQGSWGLANISGDPETGEVFSSRGAVWQTVSDLSVNNTVDILRVLNGEVTADAIANGENIREAYPGLGDNVGGRDARGGQGGANPANLRFRHTLPEITSQHQVDSIVAATNFDHLNVGRARADQASGAQQGVVSGATHVSINDLARDPVTGRMNEVSFVRNLSADIQRRGDSPILATGQNDLSTRLARIRGTEIEDRMMNPMQLAIGGQDPRLSGILPSAREAASPARNNNMRMRGIQRELESMHSAAQCNYEGGFTSRFDDVELAFYLDNFKANRVPYGVDFGQRWTFTVGGVAGADIDWPTVRLWLVQYIHYPVMLHELGHAVGQRHNFASSADAINYNDRYWAIRSDRHAGNSNMVRPRWEYQAAGQPYYSDRERNLGLDGAAYSSIMDYKTTEGIGLGRYEYAFVKHGYVNMVEAFRTVANRDRALNLFQTYSGGGQQALSFGLAGTNNNLQLTSFHYTEIPAVVGTSMQSVAIDRDQTLTGNYPNLTSANRYNVFLDETHNVTYNAFGWDPDHTNEATRGPDGSAENHLVVPYRFETDDYAGVYWFNSRYDGGADFYETMRYFSDRYIDYYPFSSFARERSSFTENGYIARMKGRYLDNMYLIMRVASIYEVFYKDIFASVTNYAAWKAQPAGVAQALGISTVWDAFTAALTMPEAVPGGTLFTLRTRPEDGSRFYEEANFGDNGAFRMPIGEGRRFQTYYDYGSGRFWREHMLNAGSYYDKVTALEYMTETFLFGLNRGLNQDLRTYQVNVYTVYPGQTMRMFGSILSEDWSDIGPQAVNPGNNVRMARPQLALLNLPQGTGPGQNGRNPMLTAVEPNLGFTGMYWTAILGMAGLSASFDQRFIQSARLWADGEVGGVTLPADQTISFRDPVTSITYRAIRSNTQVPGSANLDPGVSVREAGRPAAMDGTNYPSERGIAARMLLHANDLLRFANAQAANSPERNRAFVKLQQYVDLINIMRLLNNRYGAGHTLGATGNGGDEERNR